MLSWSKENTGTFLVIRFPKAKNNGWLHTVLGNPSPASTPAHPHLFTKASIPYKDQKQMSANVKNKVYPPPTLNAS